MEYSDLALLDEIEAGSNLAFEHLMRRYERLVYRVAFCHVRDRESAMDVTQNVFIQVHKKLSTLKNRGQFKPWLMRITVNESLNWLRGQTRHSNHEELEGERLVDQKFNQEEWLMGSEDREFLLKGLVKLNPKHRLAVILRYFEGMSIREIARTLDCSEGVIKNILFRSLRKLRGYLTLSLGVPS